MAENTASAKKKIPFCPLLSMGGYDNRICLQEKCAWYVQSTKNCAAYVVAHNCVLEIKNKQGK